MFNKLLHYFIRIPRHYRNLCYFRWWNIRLSFSKSFHFEILSHWDNLLPMFSHSFTDILKAAQLSIYSMTGFEIFLMVYPFVKEPEKSHKFAQYGALFSNFLYLFSTILAFTFFSENNYSKQFGLNCP